MSTPFIDYGEEWARCLGTSFSEADKREVTEGSMRLRDEALAAYRKVVGEGAQRAMQSISTALAQETPFVNCWLSRKGR